MLLDFIICRLPLRFKKNASCVWLFSCFFQLLHYNRQHQDIEKFLKTLKFGSKCVKILEIALQKYFKICWQPCPKFEVDQQLVRQLIYTMFITNNHAWFYF